MAGKSGTIHQMGNVREETLEKGDGKFELHAK